MAYHGQSDSLRYLILPLLLLSLVVTTMQLSCGNKKDSSDVATIEKAGPNQQTLADWPFDADALLLERNDSAHVTRTGPVQIVRLDGMPELLGQRYDEYISYACVGVATAVYDVNGVEVQVSIAQCAELQDAYGLYANHRPLGIPLSHPGAESYAAGNTRYFTHAEYFVTLSTDQISDSAANTSLAGLIDAGIESIPETPPYFVLFPFRNRLAASAHYYAYNYLGIPNFNSVYTIDYLSGSDSVTVFLALDPGGDQYLVLRSYATNLGDPDEVASTIRFEGGHGLSFEHPGAGRIVGGLARGKVVGIVGYEGLTDEALLSRWVEGLLK